MLLLQQLHPLRQAVLAGASLQDQRRLLALTFRRADRRKTADCEGIKVGIAIFAERHRKGAVVDLDATSPLMVRAPRLVAKEQPLCSKEMRLKP